MSRDDLKLVDHNSEATAVSAKPELTKDDLRGLSMLLQRVDLKGAEAMTVAGLQWKINELLK